MPQTLDTIQQRYFKGPRMLSTIKEHSHEELLSKSWQDFGHGELLSPSWQDFNYPGDFKDKKWEDFDHSQKLSLGILQSTWIVSDRKTLETYILQSCSVNKWTECRERLLDLAIKHKCFITPRYQFSKWDRIFVCSEIAHSK
jgi:hypothetical protein